MSERQTSCRNFLARARDCQGRGAEDSVHAGSRRRRTVEAIGGRRVEANATIRARCDGVAAENRGVGSRTRRFACPHAGNVVCTPSMDAIPPMPSIDLQELQGWFSERNCADTTTIAKLGELVGQGTSAMGSIAATVSLDGASRSTLMSAVIDQAEAKRRCLAVGSGAQFPSVVGNRV